MTAGIRFLLHCLAGGTIGVCTVFFAIVGALVMAFFTSGDVAVPGIIRIWRSRENGAVALNFVPDAVGMIVAAVAIAVVYVLVRMLVGRRTRRARVAE
ncbi:hypothetical protein ACIPY5_08735 [Microbacterium sp. NPDC089698]|uniref:hypothetical protein n=1 Tax=Microbacterium sp. NPDC089698 TaxID=3364200 RepID=UPI0038203391